MSPLEKHNYHVGRNMRQGDSVIGGCCGLTSGSGSTTNSFGDVRRIKSRNSGEIDIISDVRRNSDFRSMNNARGKGSNYWTRQGSQHNGETKQVIEADRSLAELFHVPTVSWPSLRFVCSGISRTRTGFVAESNLCRWIAMTVRSEGVVGKDSELQKKEPYFLISISNRISVHNLQKM